MFRAQAGGCLKGRLCIQTVLDRFSHGDHDGVRDTDVSNFANLRVRVSACSLVTLIGMASAPCRNWHKQCGWLIINLHNQDEAEN